MINFLLDHCVWKETEIFLRDKQFSLVTLRELGRPDAANGEVIALAKKSKAILITRDRDFGNISVYPAGSHCGIILLRIQPRTMEQVHTMLVTAIEAMSFDKIKGGLLTVTSNSYHLHKSII